MAFVLTSSQFDSGLQSYSALLLESLRQISVVSPFTIANVKTALDSGQIQPFDTAGFDQFLNEIYSLDLDYTSLTLAERTALNVIREYLDPPAQATCCGSDIPDPSNMVPVFYERVGSASFEYEMQIQLDFSVTCDVYDIEVSFAPLVPTDPNPLVSPVICKFFKCDTKAIYSYLWADFTGSPTGKTYSVTIQPRDSTGANIGLGFGTTYTF
jgi:hypothetical protein